MYSQWMFATQSQLFTLERKIMAAIDDLNTAIDKLQTDLGSKFAALTTEIEGLKSTGGATVDQLNSLLAKVQAADSSVSNFSA
jgi:hypothetical protein